MSEDDPNLFDNEVWVVIEEFPSYMVSSHGNVRHVSHHEPRKLYSNHQGFPTLVLWKDNSASRYSRQVNMLVAKAFCTPEHHTHTAVWHIDGNFENCRADNLLWDRRDRVLEWNDMQRRQAPKYKTPKVQVNATGDIYENAYWAGMATGEIETAVISHIERYPEEYIDRARYRYV